MAIALNGTDNNMTDTQNIRLGVLIQQSKLLYCNNNWERERLRQRKRGRIGYTALIHHKLNLPTLGENKRKENWYLMNNYV